jgi:hypothetical protein
MIKYILMNKKLTEVYSSTCIYNTEQEGIKHKDLLNAGDNWQVVPVSIPMDAEVKVNFAEFTPKQLQIIGIALENWLVEDTCISTNGKGGKPFIDKALNSKTFFERLEEASKIST